MLGAVEGDSPRPGKTADQPAEDPFGGEATVELDGSAPAEAAEVTDDADAFGESGDPFGEEADGTAPTDEAEAPADGDDPFSF